MKIDDQGNLVLSFSKAVNVCLYFQVLQSRNPTYQHCGRILKLSPSAIPYSNSIRLTFLIKTDRNFQTVRAIPAHQLPEADIVQGVILDFKDGGTLQAGCENPSAQAELLKGMGLLLLTAIARWAECLRSHH